MTRRTVSDWWVYLVRCRDKTYYCGITTDVARRIQEHNTGGGAKYTAGRYPVKLLWSHQCVSEGEARSYEYKIKNWGKIKKEKLINSDIEISEAD